MRFYYVDPPPPEDSGDGEDRCEWFTSKEAATRHFNKVRRELDAWEKERRAAEALDDPEARLAAFESLGSPWKYNSVAMGYANVETTKLGILDILNRRVRKTEMAEYQPERKK